MIVKERDSTKHLTRAQYQVSEQSFPIGDNACVIKKSENSSISL